jgi:hypothetical protein
MGFASIFEGGHIKTIVETVVLKVPVSLNWFYEAGKHEHFGK